MKKLFTLFAAVLLAAGAGAQDVFTLGGQAADGSQSWGWDMTSVKLQFTSKYGGVDITPPVFKKTDYPQWKIILGKALTEVVQLQISGTDSEGKRDFQDVDLEAGTTEMTGDFNIDEINFIRLCNNEKEGVDLWVKSFSLIDAEGNETPQVLQPLWNVKVTGGTYTTGFYNAELMINGYEDQQYKAIIIHAVDKFPPNLRMKVVYEDDSVDDPAIPGFRKTARVSFSKKYKHVSIIAPSATKFTMDIDYVECVPFTELDENSAFPSSFKEQEQGSFILKRSFSKGWNSLFVPFYIPYNKFIENFGEDTKVFKFAGYEDGHVKFEKVVANYEWDYVADDRRRGYWHHAGSGRGFGSSQRHPLQLEWSAREQQL